MMFGRKKNKKIKLKQPKIKIETIPQEFYGTHDPVVHYDQNKKSSPHAMSLGRGWSFSVGNLLHNKLFIYISLGVLFLLIVGGITWYYLTEAGIIQRDRTQPSIPAQSESLVDEVEEIIPEPVEEKTEEISTSTEEALISPTSTEEEILEDDLEDDLVELAEQETQLNFPRIILTDSVDLDSDSLTDVEEEIFNTDSGNSDTDGDGYYDGQEVYNLYNPQGIAPMKLIDSGLIAEYTNPVWQYRVYYPINWQIGEVDVQNRQVLFSTITGDYIEILVRQKKAGQTFEQWFAETAERQLITDLQPVENRFQEEGWRRKDDLVNYFVRGDNVYILIYQPKTESGFVYFRHIAQMMRQSFRPGKTNINIPEQTSLPPSLTEAEIEDIFNQSTTGTSAVTSSEESL